MNRIVLIIVAVLTIASLGFNLYLYTSRPKLAYVRSHDLIEKYAGTVDARADFERKKSAMVANVDSLKALFERARVEYMNRAGSMSQAQRSERENSLTLQHNQLQQYNAAIDSKIDEEDNKMMGAVLNQINSFVEDYAQKNDLDVIMGTTLAGSLLYGEKSLDITDQLLVELNNKYKGK
jgi:outer membrane protein